MLRRDRGGTDGVVDGYSRVRWKQIAVGTKMKEKEKERLQDIKLIIIILLRNRVDPPNQYAEIFGAGGRFMYKTVLELL